MQSVTAAGLGIGDEHPPRIMGVLNVSAESPYDPSVYGDPGEAAAYVDRELIGEGADIVDVGLESANKRFEVLSAEEELERLDVAIETIESVGGDAVFSIETRYAEVAAAALDRGFDMVNDVCGFADPEMSEVCAVRDAPVVKMASPPDLRRPGAVDDVDWAAARSRGWAEKATYVDKVYASLERGDLTDRTIVDPAFGGWSEAKTLADDRETFRRLREFRGLGRPILVSINRKNFLGELVGRDTGARLPASLAATALAVERGAHVVRTHDVAETADAATIGDAFARERLDDATLGVEELDVTNAAEAARHLGRIEATDDGAGEFALRVFELDGLSPAERDALAAGARATSARYVDGRHAAILAGSPAALTRLADRVAGESDRLDAVFAEIAG